MPDKDLITAILTLLGGAVAAWFSWRLGRLQVIQNSKNAEMSDGTNREVEFREDLFHLIEQQEARLKNQDSKIERLDMQVEESKKLTDQLKRANLSLTMENQRLKTRIQDVEIEAEKLKAEVERLKAEMHA